MITYAVANEPFISEEMTISSLEDQMQCKIAHALVMERNFREAISIYERVLKKHKKNPSIRCNLASAYALVGRGIKAFKMFESIYQDYNNYLFAKINLGFIYLGEGDTQKIREMFG